MITDFDKKGVATRFKTEFNKRLEDEDYEGAIDYLIKYSEERDNPDFHLDMGMLYLLMTQDSDDSELIYMAYREFMLQIRRDPSCALAYRNLLATEFLRRDVPDVEKYAAWFDGRGIDVKSIMDELDEAGFLTPYSVDPIDFAAFFKSGEFGEIDSEYDPTIIAARTRSIPSYCYGELEKMDKTELKKLAEAYDELRSPSLDNILNGEDHVAEKPSKIIKFEAGEIDNNETVNDIANRKVIRFTDSERDDAFSVDNEDDYREMFDKFLQVVQTRSDGESDISDPQEAEYEKRQADAVEIGLKELFDSDGIMRLAENRYVLKDYESALDLLEHISRGSENYYYVLVMRALIYLDNKHIEKAEKALAEASSLKPDGALVGTLLCRLFELKCEFDRIPDALKRIDITDFIDGDHVYRTAFKYVIKYCNEDDALDLLDEYIDEYNILDIRLAYAQIMYNRGDKDYALKELYTLSRIYYDDINVRYYYIMARMGAEKLAVDNEAPQEILAAIVDAFLKAVEKGNSLGGNPDDELFSYGLEFFISLEFRNEPRLLKRMFEAVRKLTRFPELEGKMRDALVSPYVEPIVKAVILSELLTKDPKTPFDMEIMYEPLSSDCVKTLDGEYSSGYYKAYAFIVALCPSAVDKLITAARELKQTVDAPDDDIAYYLFVKATEGEKIYDDGRIAYAMGYRSKHAVNQGLKSIEEKIADLKETDNEK